MAVIFLQFHPARLWLARREKMNSRSLSRIKYQATTLTVTKYVDLSFILIKLLMPSTESHLELHPSIFSSYQILNNSCLWPHSRAKPWTAMTRSSVRLSTRFCRRVTQLRQPNNHLSSGDARCPQRQRQPQTPGHPREINRRLVAQSSSRHRRLSHVEPARQQFSYPNGSEETRS